ncbi:MAG: T9SS type A sorting domain-containing protein, partial [Candidatus Zixiibacteriota bacterium]
MIRKSLIICVIFIIALYTPVPAQLLGDLNCNGWAWEIADAVLAAQILIESCDFVLPTCPENSDIDGDGRAFTIGDLIYYFYLGHPPNYGRHPLLDTIVIESVIAHPGEVISLPVSISTVDIIMGFQFLLEMDADYLAFDSLTADEYFYLNDCIYNEHIYFNTPSRQHFPVIDEPGVYHVCDLFLTVSAEITQPVNTQILFSSIPHQALFSGFANSDFFLPVMVDAEIEIIPLTEIESEEEIIPSELKISVYPNPFNNALNISVSSDQPTEISVYDIMGRPVKTFAIAAGNNLVKWNAADESGRGLSAGI